MRLGILCTLVVAMMPSLVEARRAGPAPASGIYLEVVSCNACGAHGNQIVRLLKQNGIAAFNGHAQCPDGAFSKGTIARASRIARSKSQGPSVNVMIGPYRSLEAALEVASRLRSLLRPVFAAEWDKAWPNSRFAHDIGNSYSLEPLTIWVVKKE